ncbi:MULTISPECIES: PLP-dependent aminotransferase family protein [unclassified Cryobacterium]|uniref:aminotransferase-like domain-containing protein n=1 Tax=unclassified Cryobacterium TaxID=2649013 RepID=UPI00106BF347|nr:MULTISPECIES: PLP-dependent aminotransferase family protein [unclassified Cryobacterium]TFB92295.1 PLP-dependent aminotransferase family protein [Cryobacterium sp. MDB2-A-1]TFC10969.1 PLP-dependent aminotransferase family protein [Cryobacterium sp. MDB2-33-2]TFC16092.1 PLP-dependent aminotransferase family protein [Cryobacterium sp. MDB2-A-2]TFC19016.1 PLP-dependent aminotransferase family protein [Cryobacterium sp. MDB2-10]TFC32103.1 PLP-dependent aminotransferase family protein [Cryobacte
MTDNSSASRIVDGIGIFIASAAPGAQLPSTRALVSQYGASPVTVQKALRTLMARGLIESRPGAGTFVRAQRVAKPNDYGWQTAALGAPRSNLPALSSAMRTVPEDVIPLHSGYPDPELLPDRLVRAAFVRAARRDAAVTRSPAAGMPELQAWFATELGSFAPSGVTRPASTDVIILPGSQSGLSTAFRALVDRGRPLLMESPTYWGAILAAAQAGVQVVPIPSGAHGPDPEDLARAFEQTGARAFYAQPTFANPTGAQWSPDRADKILEIVRRYGAFMIEDDWAHDFGITTEPTPIAARDDSGHVVYLRSLTKSVSPAVRIAGIIARGPARERLLADVHAESMYVSGILQAVALDVVTQPAWRTHLRNLRHQLAARRDLLVDALHDFAPIAHLEAVPKGGLNLWVRLPDTTDLPTFVRDCESSGVRVAPGNEWFPAEQTGAYIRLNFSGPNAATFTEGAQLIGQTLEKHRRF